MKSLTLITIAILFSHLIKAQEGYKDIAISNAELLIKAVNENDYKTYADYLTPEQYPFEDKTNLYSVWKKMLERDTRRFSDIKLERFGIYNETQQAYFTLMIDNQRTSILGISSDSGNNWHFSQFIREFNYSKIKERDMPQLDISFVDLDSNYNNRIVFNRGELITSFEFVDIKGNSLKSNEIKGKTIVLNFWSTSCAPCLKEIPELNKLVNSLDNKEIIFIAVTFYSSKEHLLNSFLPKHPFLYNIVTVNANDYKISSLPTHIIIDKNQKVIEKIVGYSEENLKKLESILYAQ